MARTNCKKFLVAKCRTHPRYTAEWEPNAKCGSCWLLYVLRWQHSEKPDKKVGSLNPFAYLIGHFDLEDACSGIVMESILCKYNVDELEEIITGWKHEALVHGVRKEK